MTTWTTITVLIDKDAEKYTGPPTGLTIDSGHDEYGWVDENRLYALAYGRYQKGRYKQHVKSFMSPWFNGATTAVICEVEDTGDNVEALIYKSAQETSDERIDGLYFSKMLAGDRFPEDSREEFADRVEAEAGVRPVIEPVETTVPPDMMLVKPE